MSSAQINLSWTASTDNVGITGYHINRNGAFLIDVSNVTVHQDTELAAGTTYIYTVEARDLAGIFSAPSAPASATTLAPDTDLPSVPTGLIASAVSASQINLNWSLSSDNVKVTTYRVYRGLQSNGSDGVLVVTLGDVTTYQDTSLTPATTYYYAVDSGDAAGNFSAKSERANATTQAAGAITTSLVPSRISGVAPLYVFFDATGTAASTTRPFHDLEYRWDFGDPTSGNWRPTDGSATGRSQNSAMGPVAAHVFETPGSYTVNLTALDGSSTATASVSITVDDPNAVFSGGSTRCFSSSSNFTDCPSGAQHITVPVSNLASAITTHQGANRRILLRRGESWTISTPIGISQTGPGIIGAFGVGSNPKPKIQTTGNNVMFQLSGSRTPGIKDWRIMDLELDGQSGTSTQAIQTEGGIDQVTLLRLNIHNVHVGASFNWNILNFLNQNGQPGHTMFDQIAVVDSTIDTIVGGAGGYGGYIAGKRFAFLGNVVNNQGGGEHGLRTPYIGKGVISNNKMSNAAQFKHVLTIRAQSFSGTTLVPPGTYTEFVVVSDNKFEGGNFDWTVTTGPQNSTANERVRNCIWERNWWTSGVGTKVALRVEASEITIRNNICDTTGSASHRCFSIQEDGVVPSPDQIRIINNTAYSADVDGDFNVVEISSTSTNVTVNNNLAYAPKDSAHKMIQGTGASGLVVSNNSSDSQVQSTFPGWLSATPTVPADFGLASGSYAINTGLPVPVFSDYFIRSRPQNGVIDRGALERP